MTQADLLHVIFSKKERSSFDLPKKHNFQWHKLGCFNGSTSNGTNWSASSNLLQKGSLPMAQAGLLHLIWSASSNGASWFALFDFLQKNFQLRKLVCFMVCFIRFSPKRITGLIHLIFARKDHFQWQKLISFKSFPSHSTMAQIDLFHLLFPQRITSYGTMSSIATLLQFCFVCIHSQLNVANIEFPA